MPPLTGRALWTQLHTFAHALPEGPLSPDTRRACTAFLASFDEAVRIASAGSCPCSQHWLSLRQARPPALDSRQAFYWWTVQIHDDVNARLGRPRLFPELA